MGATAAAERRRFVIMIDITTKLLVFHDAESVLDREPQTGGTEREVYLLWKL